MSDAHNARRSSGVKVDDARLLRHLLEDSPQAILILDAHARIAYVNKQFSISSGYSAQEVLGGDTRILRSGEVSEEVIRQIQESMDGGKAWEGELLNRRKNGELYWVHELIAPLANAGGVVGNFIVTESEITDRKHKESDLLVANTRLQVQLTEIEELHERLRQESIRDSLTHLFNRRYMEETLEREIQVARRHPMPISVVMMDVDRFKSINDTYGHQAGDAVLQSLGIFLIQHSRSSDVACRYAGDEMVLLLIGAGQADALTRANEWRLGFSELEITFGNQKLTTTLSLGVATLPEHGNTPSELLSAADKAMYMAKASRNRACLYDPSLLGDGLHRVR